MATCVDSTHQELVDSMSGGSFNYLCHKELSDLAHGFGEDWDRMLEELDELCPEAATEMRQIKASTEEFYKLHENRWARLQPVLRAVEWWRSFDWGRDEVDKAIAEFRSN